MHVLAKVSLIIFKPRDAHKHFINRGQYGSIWSLFLRHFCLQKQGNPLYNLDNHLLELLNDTVIAAVL